MFEHIPLVLAQNSPAGDKPPSIPVDRTEVPQQTGELQDGATSGLTTPTPPPSNPLTTFLPLILIVGLFWFMLMGGQRREKKKHAKLMADLGKGSRVITAGGIMGTVVDVRDREIVVKVDENANTRIKFTREAIKTVLQDQTE